MYLCFHLLVAILLTYPIQLCFAAYLRRLEMLGLVVDTHKDSKQ